MERRYVELEIYVSRNTLIEGNVDYKYLFDNSNKERLHTAAQEAN